MIAHLSIFIIAALMYLLDNFNACVISLLTSVDCLFPCELAFLSFVYQVILDFILDMVNIMLLDSVSCFSPKKDVDIFV